MTTLQNYIYLHQIFKDTVESIEDPNSVVLQPERLKCISYVAMGRYMLS